jgi:dTDP-4-dehydrorhamnose 3,5-epimerase-like enzyme
MNQDGEITAAVVVEQLGAFRNALGCLFEPLDARELALQRNVHVVLAEPGAARGNHLHRDSTEITTVVGPCLVRLREAGELRDVEVPAGEVWRFTIPPGVAHAYRNTGALPMTMVSFNTRVFDPAGSDTLREVVL